MHTSAFLAGDSPATAGLKEGRKLQGKASAPDPDLVFSIFLREAKRSFKEISKSLALTLVSPEGKETPMQMEGVVILGQLQGMLDQLVAKPKETVEFQYSFFIYSPETNALRGEVDTEFIHTGLTVYGPTIQRSLFRRRWRTGSSRWRRQNSFGKPESGGSVSPPPTKSKCSATRGRSR
jgi:hypothetical protein